MAVSLYGLRYKIAAAAVLKAAARRGARLPGARGAVTAAAQMLQPEGEATGSYRGLAAGLLRDALRGETGGEALTYDAVAGLVPAAVTERPPQVETLRAAAERTGAAADLIALGAACRKSYIADFDASAEAYEQAFAANPKDLRAVEGTVVSGARSHFDWPRIWAVAGTLKPSRGPLAASATSATGATRDDSAAGAARPPGAEFWDAVDPLFGPAPDAAALHRAQEALSRHEKHIGSLHQLLIETIAERVQFLGAFGTGARLRGLMAQNRVQELRRIPLESALWLKHLLGAYAWLEQDRALRRTAARPPVDTSDPAVARQVEKLRADVALFGGDPEPLRVHAARRAEEAAAWGAALPAEQRMAELVAGRRVAVVGPAAGDQDLGELIDSYDVVVRTNLRRPLDPERSAQIGTRTDISYYAALDLIRGYDQIAQTVESGQVQLAVTRPHCLPAFEHPPSWLRFAPFEFGLHFRGAPLGIQRILYDLLQHGPAEIGLFHADFYAGEETLAPGYRDDALQFGPHSQANDPVVMHDLSFEFRFTQRLVRAGLVTPHGTAAEVLGLSAQQYLQRLEDRSPLSGSRHG